MKEPYSYARDRDDANKRTSSSSSTYVRFANDEKGNRFISVWAASFESSGVLDGIAEQTKSELSVLLRLTDRRFFRASYYATSSPSYDRDADDRGRVTRQRHSVLGRYEFFSVQRTCSRKLP